MGCSLRASPGRLNSLARVHNNRFVAKIRISTDVINSIRGIVIGLLLGQSLGLPTSPLVCKAVLTGGVRRD